MRAQYLWLALKASVRSASSSARGMVVGPADNAVSTPGRPEAFAGAHQPSGSASAVIHPWDIAGSAPYGRSADQEVRVPHQLPADLHRFVGRARELKRLHAQISYPDAARVLAIVGTPGCGKTTLAIHLAHQLLDQYPDGQLLISLNGSDTQPDLSAHNALGVLLRSLGENPAKIPEPLEERAATYRTLLSERRVLILADNAADARVVRLLLPAGEGNLVIVTSRNDLSTLTPLHGASHLRLSRMPAKDAQRLFRTVTRGARHDSEPEVARIVEQCAHLPLAVRIVAERAVARPLRPLAELIEDLQSRTTLWQVLASEDDEEADAVRTVFDSSYQALPRPLARAFRLIGLHPGSDFTLEAAAALLDEPVDRASAKLDALANLHLLERDAHRRYLLHDLLRAYAADQADIDEKPEHRHYALLRITTWYLLTVNAAVRMAQKLHESVLTDPVTPGVTAMRFSTAENARAWFTAERPNLLAAISRAYECNLDDLAWKLAATCHPLYAASSAIDDWKAAAHIGLEASRRLGLASASAQLLSMLANAHTVSNCLDEAAELHRQALSNYEACDDRLGQVRATNSLGLIHLERRELQAAAAHFERTLALARAGGYPTWTGLALDNLGATHHAAGEPDQAAARFHQALEIYRNAAADTRITVVPLLQLSRLHREANRLALAEQTLTEAEGVLTGDGVFLSVERELQLERAALVHAQGDYGRAESAYRNCLNRQEILHSRSRQAAALHGLGTSLARQGRYDEAVTELRNAIAIRRDLPNPLHLSDALADLSDVLDQHGDPDSAVEARKEAAALLTSLNDRRATTLRERLTGSGIEE